MPGSWYFLQQPTLVYKSYTSFYVRFMAGLVGATSGFTVQNMPLKTWAFEKVATLNNAPEHFKTGPLFATGHNFLQ